MLTAEKKSDSVPIQNDQLICFLLDQSIFHYEGLLAEISEIFLLLYMPYTVANSVDPDEMPLLWHLV